MSAQPYVVLIVDDDEDMSELVKFACKEMGLSTHNVTNSKQAQKWLDSNTPGLMILDIMMPDGNGLDFLRGIRGQPKFARLPIIVTSGLKDEETARDALELGASDFLRKPYEMKVLREKITRLKTS